MNEHTEQLRQVIDAALMTMPPEHFTVSMEIDAILAATYPPACQTCGGDGVIVVAWGDVHGMAGETVGHYTDEQCPDCPTIAQLLAWGVAVATAEIEMGLVEWGDQSWLYADRLLDAIRAVQP